MLELKGISFALSKEKVLLKNINLQLETGKFIAITGPNGGGKTTLAKVISGILPPTQGQIYFSGKNISRYGITQRAQLGICHTFQQPVYFKGITVGDLLCIAHGNCQNLSRYLEEAGLHAEEYLNREINSSLSGGELRRIELACALARDASVFIFDEPEAGIDLWSFGALIQVLKKLKGQGKSILLISHQEQILSSADEHFILSDGMLYNNSDNVSLSASAHLQTEAGICHE